MTTLGQLIYNIRNSRGERASTDDFSISDRQMEFIINHFRVEIASQRRNNRKSNDGIVQQLEDLKLVKTKDFVPYDPSVMLLRSTSKIPSLATDHNNGYMIDYVGTRDGVFGFDRSNVEMYNIALCNEYVANVYFIVDDYLYIATKSERMLREVYMKAIFNDPREVLIYNEVLDALSGLNWEYPIPGNLIGSLNNMVLNNEFRWNYMIQPDLINDGKDAQ